MKYLILLIILFFVSCSINNIKQINLLTNDLMLVDVVDNFNYVSKNIKIKIDYIKEKKIFDYYLNNNNQYNFDIIAGLDNDEYVFDSNNFKKIKIYNKKENFYNSILEKYNKNNFYFQYGIDFPVIVILKNSNINIRFIDFYDIPKYSVKYNKNEIGINNNKIIKIGFSPLLSNYNYLNYIFLFNSYFVKKDNHYILANDDWIFFNNFLFNYDELYNYGYKETNNILKNIDKVNLISREIISLDIINYSSSLYYDNNKIDILLLKNIKYLSLYGKYIAINNKTLFYNESNKFINFLLSKEIQKNLFNLSITNKLFEEKHIPIIAGIIEEYNKSLNIDKDLLENYISQLKPIIFPDNKIKKKFFESYNYVIDLLNNNQMENINFIDLLNNEMIK